MRTLNNFLILLRSSPACLLDKVLIIIISSDDLNKKVAAEVEIFPLLRLSVFGIKFNQENPISSVDFEQAMTHHKKCKEEIANYLGTEAIYSTPIYKDSFYDETFSIPDLYIMKDETILIHYEIALLQNLYLLEKSLQQNKL